MPGRLSKCILVSLMLLYSASNLLLFVTSAAAWSLLRRGARNPPGCRLSAFAIDCGLARWSLYALLTPAALVAFTGSATMAANALLRARACPIDPLFVFRCVFFSLLLLAPTLALGWSSPYTVYQHVPRLSHTTNAHVAATPPTYSDDSELGLSFAGLLGAFVLESMDHDFGPSKPAFYMAHINVLFGAFIASVSAAMAPPAGIMAVFPSQGSKDA